MDFHHHVLGLTLETIATEGLNNQTKLYRILRTLAKYRSQLIANTIISKGGLIVRSGPFAGMILPNQVSEGCFVPKLLGCYEQELHSWLWQIQKLDYPTVVNIGCAEGYYAVGLARLLPKAQIWAYDIDPNAQQICRQVADLNTVGDRIHVGAEFKSTDFKNFNSQKPLLICDIEGAEINLLNPDHAPDLQQFDILVEMHDTPNQAISQILTQRFSNTHTIQIVTTGSRDLGAYPEIGELEHLDQLLAVWEWRLSPTPWAWLRSKDGRC